MVCAQPHASTPDASRYPGGTARSNWHIEQGMTVFQQHFGQPPHGVWLSEGGISPDALALLQQHHIRWTASGEGVWRHSMQRSGHEIEGEEPRRALFQPNRYRDNTVRIFFRDDGLSDLIGFVYSGWNPTDAVADFVQHLLNIADFLGEEAGEHVVSVILDGENAWEYYPDNGFHFLNQLYTALSQHERINTLTLNAASQALEANELKAFCPGSWVYGSFSTWIGHDEKNRAWDYLVEAKHAYDRAMESGTLKPEQREKATQQLAICEGSDWFWWFGDHNPAESVSDFDRLFRQQLRRLYQLLGEAEPVTLDVPLSHGGGQAENAGTMRRNV
jgi:alpha-amylase/alpha-mannosidase (GH57 family)